MVMVYFTVPAIKRVDEKGNPIPYTKEYMREYITKVHKVGGVVSLWIPSDRFGNLSDPKANELVSDLFGIN